MTKRCDVPRMCEKLLSDIRRMTPYFHRGIISGREFIAHILDQFAHLDRTYPEIIPQLWDSIPDSLRAEFAAKVREAAQPKFRWKPFYIKGAGIPSNTDSEGFDHVGTARIRAWALEFLRFLDSSDEDLRESLAAIEQGLADAESGRTRPFREVLDAIRNDRTKNAADDTDR